MKKNILKILTIIVIVILLLNTNVILATTESDISNLKAMQNENNKEKKEAQEELQEVQSQKSEAMKQVETLTTQINSYESQIEELNTKLEELNTKIEEEEKNLKQKEEEYNENQKLFEERIVAAYEAGDTSYLDMLLSSESLTDLISNYYLISELATYEVEFLDTIQKQKEEIENAKKEIEKSKAEVEETKTSKETATNELKQAKTEKSNYVTELTEDEKKIQEKIEEIEKANVQIDSDIRAKQALIQAAKQTSSSNNSSSSSNSGKASSAGFIRPTSGPITTGMYYSSGGYHGAVDFGSAGINGSPVYAVADGVVITTRALTTSYGNYIIIYHPSSDLYTLYAHGQQGSICVSEWQEVKQGQQIMRVGSTGNSSGPHLHFEVRLSPGTYSNRVDPRNYLP